MVHEFIEFLPDNLFELFGSLLDPLVLTIVDEGGVGLGDELDEGATVVGQFSGDLEPLVLGLHEVGVEALDQGLVVPLQ